MPTIKIPRLISFTFTACYRKKLTILGLKLNLNMSDIHEYPYKCLIGIDYNIPL